MSFGGSRRAVNCGRRSGSGPPTDAFLTRVRRPGSPSAPSNVPALSCECQREALSSRPPALVSSNVQLGSYVAEHGFFVSRSQVSRIALCPNLRSNQLTKCRTRRYVKGRQKTTERLLGLNG